jgi:cytoskeletal protein CcmA (bactofilin family)
VRRFLLLALTLLALCSFAQTAAAKSLNAEADDDAIVVINGDVEIEHGELSQGVYIVEGDAFIRGRVHGDVVLVEGKAVIRGRVSGDVVTLAGRAYLLPRARVGGDLIYADEPPRVARGARLGGKVEKLEWSDVPGLAVLLGAVAFWLAMTVSAAILGVLLLLLAPRAADAVMAQAESRFWTAVWLGAGIFIALPLLVLLAAVTLLGLPFALALLLAWLPLAAVAYVTTAWTLGRALVKPPSGRFVAFFAGFAILRAAALIPGFGLLVWLAAAIVGLGLLGAAIAAARPAPAR